jgi:hypothetical protein
MIDAPAHPAAIEASTHRRPASSTAAALLVWILLAASAIFFAFHFIHLTADFPNHSPWVDWSKYTDEGWYGDAAIRHYLFGHWYWRGDFNPAVALPIWPALELLVFRFTGVSLTAARSLTLCIFALTLFTLDRLIERHTRPRTGRSGRPLAAALTVFLLCVSPFLFAFDRLAIIEPLLISLTALALLAASHLHPLHLRSPGLVRLALPAIALGILLPCMVLAKTTALFLFPSVAYLLWARAGYRLRPALRLALLPAALGTAIWLAYFLLFVRPHYLADFHYLFSANAYTGVELQPLYTVVLNTLSDGGWIGVPLYAAFFATLALALFWRPRLLTNPLFPALLLWIAGYFFFLGYHNNLQPRYYTVIAVPITAVVALGLDTFRQARGRVTALAGNLAVAAVVLAIALPDALQQIDFLLHPTWTFEAAAHSIADIVRADPNHPSLILSISGSDLTLMTHLPSIDDDFGTMELPERVRTYRPGWYVSWNELDDDKMDALTPLYTVNRVAAFPAMDDPDRNLLILYRLDPTDVPAPTPKPHPRTPQPLRTPKPLQTRIGQQPSTNQLEH